MIEPCYRPGEGLLVVTEQQLEALGLVGLAGAEGAAEAVGADAVRSLKELGAILFTGSLDEPLLRIADTVVAPELNVAVRALHGGSRLAVSGWASYHTFVAVLPVEGGLLRVQSAAAVDMPNALAGLIDLGPRPRPANRNVFEVDEDDLERGFVKDEEIADCWPELSSVPFAERRLVNIIGTRPEDETPVVSVSFADTGAAGYWAIEGLGRGRARVQPSTSVATWASLTSVLRTLFSA